MVDPYGDFIGRTTRDKDDIKYQFEETGAHIGETPLFVIDGATIQVKEIRLIVKTRNVLGPCLIWGHPSNGIWGTHKWCSSITVKEFILDHPVLGVLDENVLTVTSFILGSDVQGVLGVQGWLGAQGGVWEIVTDETYDP